MHRPFYSLAVLLQLIALSLILVGSARSQSWQPWLASAEKTAQANGEAVKKEWLKFYNSIVAQVTSSASQPIQATGSLPWCAARDVIQNDAKFVPTGYDADYDFAMLRGSYDDMAISTTDIENSVAMNAEDDQPGVEVVSTSGPATKYYFDDWTCCIDAGFSQPSCIPSRFGGSRGDLSWCGQTEEWVDASDSSNDQQIAIQAGPDVWNYLSAVGANSKQIVQNALYAYVSPIAGQQYSQWTWLASEVDANRREAQQTLEYLTVAADAVTESSNAILNAAWIAITEFRYSEFAMEEDLYGEYSVSFITSEPAPDYGMDTGIIVQAATALDQLSVLLQQAAQELRYFAADGVVTKGTSNLR